MISVCMATYNGETYLEEQLNCIYLQTLKPDEVILCDDCSTDRTVEIIRAFIEKNNLQDSWHLYCNEENKGYPGNFYYAMSLCSGNLIFLADQDDVWHEKKIEKMAGIMNRMPEVDVLACKFGLVDEKGEDIHTVMAPSRSLGTGELSAVSMKDIFGKYRWPGMVLLYRRDWYENHCRADITCKVPHDFWICLRASEGGTLFSLDEELAWHRRHDNNAAEEEHRIKKLLNRERKLGEIDKYIRMLEGCMEGHLLGTAEGKQVLEEKLLSMEERKLALQSGSVREVIRNGLRNKKYTRFATFVCDLLIIKQK